MSSPIATRDTAGEGITFIYAESSVLPFKYCYQDLMNGDKTDMEYSLAPAYDLIRFWRSKVKVTVGVRDVKRGQMLEA